MSKRNIPLTMEILRRRKGLSQYDLMTKLGVSQPEISQFESGIRRPKPEQLKQLVLLFKDEISNPEDLFVPYEDFLRRECNAERVS